MKKAILKFSEQLIYEPKIENEEGLRRSTKVIVCGMGGSHLAADLLNEWSPDLDIWVWKDYGLPPLPENTLRESLVVASSYSGNTEETLDAYKTARDMGLAVVAVATGGELLRLAKEDKVPFVILPDTGVQPRAALGYSVRALLAIFGQKEALMEMKELNNKIHPEDLEDAGRDLAARLKGYVPVIYASRKNWPLAYNWKIKFNETGKIPAFANMLPELNHNEMNGFDVESGNRPLAQNFAFIFLSDPTDDPRVQKRMSILKDLYEKRKLPVYLLDLKEESSVWQKIFNNLILADWTAYHTALQYGLEPEKVPMVEEFKKLIK